MSELRAATVSNLAGTGPATLTGQIATKGWFNFNGTGTVALRDSFNVSSLIDNGTGDYTTNFTSAFLDANWSGSGSACTPGVTSGNIWAWPGLASGNMVAGSVRIATGNVAGSALTDMSHTLGSAIGDLA